MCRVIEPEYEDTQEQAEERTRRAREVAVDSDWVLHQSKMSSSVSGAKACLRHAELIFKRQTRGNSKKHETYLVSPDSTTSSLLLSDSLNILVTERHKLSPRRPALPLQHRNRGIGFKAPPSPHELKPRRCYSILPVEKVIT